MSDVAPEPQPDARAQPEGVIDLLGVLAYAELTAFSRLAADSELAPTQPLKASLAKVAVIEFGHYEHVVAALRSIGADPEAAMAPFIPAFDAFHERTKPSTWLEGLVKAYIGDGIATDFYTEVAQYVDQPIRGVILTALQDGGRADFVVSVVRDAIRADPRVGGRLALFGRRMVGEALTQGQQVAVERDGLAALFVGGPERGGADLAEVGRMFARITDRHSERMARLGLSA
ncbi:MAG: ferritin-like fold-containing protein [Nostocoides sp.]